MQYIPNDLESWERQGMFILIDKYDQDNGLPISRCRVYGISWWGKNISDDGEGYQHIKTPTADYIEYPFGRYINESIKENIKESGDSASAG